MARQARCWRVRSAVTPQRGGNEAARVNIHLVIPETAAVNCRFQFYVLVVTRERSTKRCEK